MGKTILELKLARVAFLQLGKELITATRQFVNEFALTNPSPGSPEYDLLYGMRGALEEYDRRTSSPCSKD